MEQQKIVFVSHCALNTAAKVQRSAQEGEQEEKLRREFLHWVVDQGIQLIQLPCPEFTFYGASRWGHVKEQFDNPFFRDHCRKILQPVIQQMKAAQFTRAGKVSGAGRGRYQWKPKLRG